MTSFAGIFLPAALREAVADEAWLEAMLEAERALAAAEAAAGVIPAEAATAIAAGCDPSLYDVEELAEQGRAVGNPAEPLVRALREQVGEEAASFVHRGATSQDVVDTAAMLVAHTAAGLVLDDLDAVARACAFLAEVHRDTAMAGRTLLQQAVPTTFGLKAAVWLDGILDAQQGLARIRDDRLAVQLGGAAGTLSVLGDAGPEVLRLYAAELGLAEPDVPWHANRSRIGELAAALQLAAGAAAKIALDIVLLAQSEVGEVAEAEGGGSSTMPHKRNPARSAIAIACARQASGHASVLLGGLAQEHERGAGGWQAEWGALSGLLGCAGGAVAAVQEALDGLEVDFARMEQNLEASGGLVLAERLSGQLARRLGAEEAHALLADAAVEAAGAGDSLREILAARADLGFSEAELDELLDPETYLGAAGVFVDRVLERWRGPDEDDEEDWEDGEDGEDGEDEA
ncbi:MAG TPA: 3-carboxy-cis,cis-muconate cycloisomerase [Gaiellaceae bacterium]|nr:3-carboxy-cis,cis-muconate cycloisomerase [Gaiellaceae bacterium]